jgi:hypothetical protein
VTERFGAPLTSEALTNDDVATQEYEAYKLVRTDGNGILPVDISGNAAKVAGKIIAVNNLSDGQVMVWRAYDQRWHNENKSAVGEGKALEITNGSTTLVVYSGDEDKSVDVGKWNNVTLSKTVENIADIRYIPVLESSSAETGKLQKATPEPDGKTIAMRDTEGCLIATTPATADDSQKVATTANVKAKIAAHNNDSGAHSAAFAVKNKELMENTLGYRKADTAYTAGKIAYHASLPTGYYLKCTTPGTTGSGDLSISSTTIGDTVTDGTVTWVIMGNADRRLSNLDTANLACHVVVDSYYDSATGDWWREYDDGWVEQGGFVVGSVSVNTTVNLLKPYSNTNYAVQLLYNTITDGATSGATASANLKTTTTFALGSYGGSYAWVALGMGAQS